MRQKAAEALLLKMGITFNVYGRDEGREKIFPFDLIPRIVPAEDWQQIETGLKQRIFALNEFLQDVYNDKKILKDRVIPEELILSSRTYREECEGFTPPKGIWCHITGTDLVRDRDGRFYVLEDNLRCPSGVSYVLENRHVLKRSFPQVFEASRVRPVDDYPSKLLETLENLVPEHVQSPTIGILTPGIYNSAYFEHSFLSQQMGVELELIGADASDAWLSVYVPDTGWVDLDPTNNLIPNTKHITLAWGRDYGDVTPVKGVVMGGGRHTLSVMVDVTAKRTKSN